jgi:histidinol-phosphatase
VPPCATTDHDPAPPCRITVTAENWAPGLAVSCTAAHDGSDAARRQVATSALPDAPDTAASIATRMGPVSTPQGPGGPVVLVGVVVVVGAVVVLVVVLVLDDVDVAGDVVVVERAAVSVSSSRIARATTTAATTRTTATTAETNQRRAIRPVSRARAARPRSRRARAGYIPGISAQPDLVADLELAHALADAADAVTMSRFRAADLVVETKPDLTPVTEADRAVEELLLGRLAEVRPADAVLGEEFGTRGAGSRRWIIDPIDGTKGYARGIPVWATLIALEVDDELVAGVVSAPALGSRWSAARGLGAERDGDAVSVSKVARIEDAHLAYDSVDAFESVGLDAEFLALARRCWRVRGFGDFWAHMLVADGSIDIAVEVGGLAVWDIAAVKVVVDEAGGRCTDVRGDVRIDTGDVISTNGLLHDDVVAAFARS